MGRAVALLVFLLAAAAATPAAAAASPDPASWVTSPADYEARVILEPRVVLLAFLTPRNGTAPLSLSAAHETLVLPALSEALAGGGDVVMLKLDVGARDMQAFLAEANGREKGARAFSRAALLQQSFHHPPSYSYPPINPVPKPTNS